MSITQTRTRHEDVAAALMAAGIFVKAHADDLPLSPHGNPLLVAVEGGTDEEKKAEIDRIAAVLNVRARFVPGGQYEVSYPIGAGVEYVAYMFRSRRRADGREPLTAAVIDTVASQQAGFMPRSAA